MDKQWNIFCIMFNYHIQSTCTDFIQVFIFTVQGVIRVIISIDHI